MIQLATAIAVQKLYITSKLLYIQSFSATSRTSTEYCLWGIVKQVAVFLSDIQSWESWLRRLFEHCFLLEHRLSTHWSSMWIRSLGRHCTCQYDTGTTWRTTLNNHLTVHSIHFLFFPSILVFFFISWKRWRAISFHNYLLFINQVQKIESYSFMYYIPILYQRNK